MNNLKLNDDIDENNQIYVYKNEKYGEKFFADLRRLHQTNKYTDVILTSETGQNQIACHKLILSILSPYFEAMFSSDLIETHTNQVRLLNTDDSTLTHVITYAYSGEIELNVNNVENIFVLASMLQINDLSHACWLFMQQNLDVNNCVSVYVFGKRHELLGEETLLNVKDFFNKNIIEISKSSEFLDFNDSDILIELLSGDELDVPNEYFILDLLLNWLNFKKDERKFHLEKLILNTVRLNLVDKPKLKQFCRNYSNEINECSEKLTSLLSSCLSGQCSVVERKRTGMTKAAYCFLLVGGNCNLADGSYVNCFNPHNGEKFFLSRDFQQKTRSTSKGYFHIENPGLVVTDDNRVFVAGGNYVYHEYKLFNSVLNGERRSATKKSTTKQTKDSEIASLDNEKDCFNDGEEILSKETYEYENQSDTWTRRANMLFAKANFALCSMGDRVYSFGGVTVDQEQLDLVEYYDIGENKWSYFCSMPSPFVAGCVVRHNECFYVMGGRSGVGRFDNCFKFEPASRAWTEIERMNVGRFNFGACVLNGRIFVFGGQRYNESGLSYYTREALDSVEVYDFELGKWCMGARMPNPLYNIGVCLYDDDESCVYVCGTTECSYSGATLAGFMFTSVFKLEVDSSNCEKMRWSVCDKDVSDIKTNYRCAAARINTRKLHRCEPGKNK